MPRRRMFTFPSQTLKLTIIVLLLVAAAWLLATVYTTSFCLVSLTDNTAVNPQKHHTDSMAGSDVDCEPNVPCSYPETVDLRVVVITYNLAVSVMKLLRSLDTVHTDGDSARLEIWIDRDRQGQFLF